MLLILFVMFKLNNICQLLQYIKNTDFRRWYVLEYQEQCQSTSIVLGFIWPGTVLLKKHLEVINFTSSCDNILLCFFSLK